MSRSRSEWSEVDEEKAKQLKVVIACRVMEPGLERVRMGIPASRCDTSTRASTGRLRRWRPLKLASAPSHGTHTFLPSMRLTR